MKDSLGCFAWIVVGWIFVLSGLLELDARRISALEHKVAVLQNMLGVKQ